MAARYLETMGYTIVECNWRCRLGEVDIVAEDDGVLVFVEVRTRTGNGFGTPQESVDRRKQARLRRVAQMYVQAQGKHNRPLRLDVVAIEWRAAEEEAKITHIPHAF